MQTTREQLLWHHRRGAIAVPKSHGPTPPCAHAGLFSRTFPFLRVPRAEPYVSHASPRHVTSPDPSLFPSHRHPSPLRGARLGYYPTPSSAFMMSGPPETG